MPSFLEFIATLIIALLITFVVVEWSAGCGETWIDAQGNQVQGECFLQ